MSAVIELDGLEVTFGKRRILADLRAKLKGKALGLLGPNGAGKTTLLHTLLGFHAPSSGTARIFGKDIRTELREVRAMLGYMPETDSFIAGQSAVRLTSAISRVRPRSAACRPGPPSSGPTRRCSTWAWARLATASSKPTPWV